MSSPRDVLVRHVFAIELIKLDREGPHQLRRAEFLESLNVTRRVVETLRRGQLRVQPAKGKSTQWSEPWQELANMPGRRSNNLSQNNENQIQTTSEVRIFLLVA